ncbi:MAG: ribonuclease P protein component [Deltaproteobacteria bacterium]|nr:ribonuclease P protein component [Deltaproteobacteria bacterium]
MSNESGEHFPKHIRLRRRGEYLVVQRSGHKVQSRAFIGLVRVCHSGNTRLGITTTKRIGNAVTRNRTKRLVREAFRRGKMDLPDGIDLVVIAKKKAVDLDSNAIFDDLCALSRHVRELREQVS